MADRPPIIPITAADTAFMDYVLDEIARAIARRLARGHHVAYRAAEMTSDDGVGDR